MTTPRVFLLPKDTYSSSSSNFTVISLPHPRTSAPTRFLIHSGTGLHEITKIAPPATTPRSWLLTNTLKPVSSDEGKKEDEEEKVKAATPEITNWLGNGQTIQDASLYVSTPIDPLFILLPRLLPVDAPKAHFLPLDDILDTFTATDDDAEDDADKSHWEAVLKFGSQSRRHAEARVKAVCDMVDVGEEMAYRPSQEKALALLVAKCEGMAKGGLPKSMEDAFVVKPLVRPISEVLVQQEKEEKGGSDEGETATTTTLVETQSGEEKKDADTTDKESQPTPPLVHPTILNLLRLRVASQFLSASYLPAYLSAALTTTLSSTYDFAPLDTHLAELRRLRSEVASLRSDDFSLKRNYDEDGRDAGARKKQKMEEEETEKKRKKNVSRGVRDLGKVNTKGMAKMTSFFKKKQ